MGSDKQNNFLPPLEQAKALAGNPAARELAALLQKQGGTELQQALDQAANGDLNSARQTISTLLSSPEAQKLLKQLGG